MTGSDNRLDVLVAKAGSAYWAERLARAFATHPMGFHWSGDVDDAVGLALLRTPHLAIVDDRLPRAGGLDALRRMRQSGLTMPCLLVAEAPDRRTMVDAMQLNVFSVVTVDDVRDLLTPVVMKIVRQVYQLDWPDPDTLN